MHYAAHRHRIFEAGAAQRIAAAVVLSVAAHAAAIVAIRAGPPQAAIGAKTIEARMLPLLDQTGSETTTVASSPEFSAAKEPDRSESVAPLTATGELGPAELAPAAEARPQPATTTEPIAHPSVQRPAQLQNIPLASDSTYHLITALDRPPAPLAAPDVCFPAGATGELTYELLIDETGIVNEAAILSAAPRGLPASEAVERCRALKFSPAIKDGRAVKSKVRLVVGTQ